MGYRRPRKKSKYFVEPELFDNVVTFVRCYPLWIKDLETLPDSSKAITYDSEKVQTSNSYDATSELALKRVEIEHKVTIVEDAAKQSGGDFWEWIIKGTTTRDFTIEDLIAQGMPCSRGPFIKMRQHFYYLVSKKI